LINYRGRALPIVDLYAAILGRPAERCMSTRIVIAHCEGAPEAQLALFAEHATECIRFDAAQFSPAAVTPPGYLGPVTTDAQGRIVQWIRVEALLPAAVRETLAWAEPTSA